MITSWNMLNQMWMNELTTEGHIQIDYCGQSLLQVSFSFQWHVINTGSVTEREKSLLITDPPVEPISSCRDESGYVPTVGRWGSEWPSWLETEDWEHLTGSGEWPEGHPLPLPSWGSPKAALRVPSVEQYEDLASNVELTVQQLLQAHNYNSVGNLLRWVWIVGL